MSRGCKIFRYLFAWLALLFLGGVQTQASVLYATGFENPPFVPGPIDGQAGWFVFSASGQTSAPVIETTVVNTGAHDTGYAGGIDINGASIAAITSGFPIVGTFTRDTWHHVDVVLDYVSQTFALDLDGSTLATNIPFCGNNF